MTKKTQDINLEQFKKMKVIRSHRSYGYDPDEWEHFIIIKNKKTQEFALLSHVVIKNKDPRKEFKIIK